MFDPIYLYFIPKIITWSLDPFLRKLLGEYLDALEQMYIGHLIYWMYLLVGFFYLLFYKKDMLSKSLRKMEKLPLKLYLYMIGNIFLSFISFYCTVILLRRFDVTYYIPFIRGISSILIALIGYYIFKEKFTRAKLLGFVLVIIGMFLINYKFE